MNDRMIEFRLAKTHERVLFRVSMILCLFPEHFQIRTIENSWTLEVEPEDWPKVERAFRNLYLGGSFEKELRLKDEKEPDKME